MNRIMRRGPIKVALFAAVLLVTGLLARPASAQAWIQGKFTLPYETRWGQAVLPPGDYQLTFVNDNGGTMLSIRDAKSLRHVAFEPVNIREDSREQGSALLIGTRGKQHVVYSLTIADLGESFVYQRPPGHGRALEEVSQAQTIPVVVARK